MEIINPTRCFRFCAIFFFCIACLACRVSVSAFQISQSSIYHNKFRTQLFSTPGDFGELTSALATLDQQWQIQQRDYKPDKPRWSKLMLPKQDDDDDDDDDEEARTILPQEEFVWMLEPPNNSIPSCVVVFTGGAGLGQFPQVAYNELLSEVSTKLNAVCLTAPYEVGLDHFSLAKVTGEKLRRALLVLDEKRESEGHQVAFPKYSLAHSLGCKLQTIYLAATGLSDSFDGVGFLAYNNFSFAKTIGMARSFAQELRGGGSMNMGAVNPEMINSFFDFAEMAVGAVGLEFSPTPGDTERLIQLRYSEELQAKTRVFKFGSDQLDSSQEFREAAATATATAAAGETNSIQVSNLEGGHLTPVYFQWNADDLAKDAMGGFADTVSQDNLNMAKEAMGGFQGASFGDEPLFRALVDEVCGWILGKPPKQPVRPQISDKSSA